MVVCFVLFCFFVCLFVFIVVVVVFTTITIKTMYLINDILICLLFTRRSHLSAAFFTKNATQ